jgi:hypothetical protein
LPDLDAHLLGAGRVVLRHGVGAAAGRHQHAFDLLGLSFEIGGEDAADDQDDDADRDEPVPAHDCAPRPCPGSPR